MTIAPSRNDAATHGKARNTNALLAPRSPRDRGFARHRGIAMLLTLLAVMVVSTIGLALLRTSAAFSLRARHELFETRARVLALDLRAGLVAWVEQTPSDRASADRPIVGTIGDWTIDVQAVDLAGRLHVRWLALSPELAATLPPAFSGARVPARFDGVDWDESSPHERPALEELVADKESTPTAPEIAQFLTVAGSGALNIATAPPPLLERVLQELEVEPHDARALLAARGEEEDIDGALANRVLSAANSRARQAGRPVVPLTMSPGPWGMIVTLTEGAEHSRFWMVIEQARGPSGNRPLARWTVTEFRRVP